ncbi:hypothetical protein [Sutcliffiella horikoshii]|uniref:hypothetical protein n=1 Tax=Sutcliffiella horikoshii TaxID=79883 RepID=UPI00384E00AA
MDILALLFLLLAAFHYFKFWKRFRRLEGERGLSRKFVNAGVKNIRVATVFLVTGCMLGIISIWV